MDLNIDLGSNVNSNLDIGSNVLDIGSNVNSNLDIGSNVLDLGSNVLDIGSNILDIGSNVLDIGSNILDIGSNILDIGSNPNALNIRPNIMILASNLDPNMALDSNIIDLGSNVNNFYAITSVEHKIIPPTYVGFQIWPLVPIKSTSNLPIIEVVHTEVQPSNTEASFWGTIPEELVDIPLHMLRGNIDVVSSNVTVVADTEFVNANRVAGMEALRKNRNVLLTKTDWVSGDVPMSADLRSNWSAYRQALRDLPEKVPEAALLDSTKIIWPQQP